MHTVETVTREFNGQKQEVKMLFGTGRLTNDPPAVHSTPQGKIVLSSQKGHRFAIAFNNGKDKDADFYGVEAWGKTAENLSALGFKGQSVEVAGRIREDKYTVNGEERVSMILTVERFDVKSYKDQGTGSNAAANTPANASNTTPDASNYTRVDEDPFANSSGPFEVSDDDLPF